jgi:hypothetical protein
VPNESGAAIVTDPPVSEASAPLLIVCSADPLIVPPAHG